MNKVPVMTMNQLFDFVDETVDSYRKQSSSYT